MQVTTTFRGLSKEDSATATNLIERHTSRLDRLVDEPVTVRAVIEGKPPEYTVTLSMSIEREDLVAQCAEHELSLAVAEACERLRNQLVRMRQRRQSTRLKASSSSEASE